MSAAVEKGQEAGHDVRWTFLTNHTHVLILLAAHPDMVLREVAVRVGITERAVQRIVSELEEEGYVTREKVGRQNTYRLHLDRPLRHAVEGHRTIGDIVRVILSEGVSAKGKAGGK